MKLNVYNIAGEVVGDIELDDTVFGIPANVPLMHQAVVQIRANARVGTASTKTRAEIRGTTRKMYKQKGTGRARHGSRKVPLWTGGGVAHGPHPRSYEQHMPKKMRRQAVRSALSVKARDNQIVLLQELTGFDEPRTKDMIGLLGRLPVNGKILITLDEANHNAFLSARNIPNVNLLPATSLNTQTLLLHDYLVATVPAIRAVEQWLGRAGNGAAAPAEEPSVETPTAKSRSRARAATVETPPELEAATETEAGAEAAADKPARARRASTRKSDEAGE